MLEKQRYQVTQDDQDYILSTYLMNDKIYIECQDNNYSSLPTYGRGYSLEELKSFSEIFSFINNSMEGLNEFNNAIDRQQVKIMNKGEKMEILFNIQANSYEQELTFQLPLIKKSEQNVIKSGPITQITEANPQPQIIEESKGGVILGVEGPPNDENDYPDCTYSTKPTKEVYHQPIQEVTVVQNEIGCGCVPDHDRINKIETNSQFLKSEHEGLKQRLENLKMKIEMINKQTSEIRGENGMLNSKTLELKRQYNNLIEAEAALRAENDELRREKHELTLKKNELAFYMNDHHNHDTVREVNIPIDEKKEGQLMYQKKKNNLEEDIVPLELMPGIIWDIQALLGFLKKKIIILIIIRLIQEIRTSKMILNKLINYF